MGFVQDWIEDRAVENRTYDPRTGKHKASWWDSAIGGMTGADVHGAISDTEEVETRRKVDDYLGGKGLSRDKLGLSDDVDLSTAQGAVTTYLEKRQEGRDKTAHTRSLEPVKLQMQQQTKALEASTKASERAHEATMTQLQNQNNLGIAQLTQSNNQFMAQMADAKDQRALELQIRREELDRADARDARNRRRDSIAALTSGLAALGAAFAL